MARLILRIVLVMALAGVATGTLTAPSMAHQRGSSGGGRRF